MTAAQRLYFKIFLLATICYFTLTLLLETVYGDPIDWMRISIMAIVFGIFITLWMAFLHVSEIKKLGISDISANDLSPKQEARLESPMSLEEMIHQLKEDRFFGKMDMHVEQDIIHLRSGLSWRSYGDKTSIQLVSKEDENFIYKITSRPQFFGQLIDCGRNLELVYRVKQLMQNRQELHAILTTS